MRIVRSVCCPKVRSKTLRERAGEGRRPRATQREPVCFENPAWLDPEEADPWDCTLDCESNESVPQAMLSCMGEQGSDEAGLAECELLLGESVQG